jgi:hypothetical protein
MVSNLLFDKINNHPRNNNKKYEKVRRINYDNE